MKNRTQPGRTALYFKTPRPAASLLLASLLGLVACGPDEEPSETPTATPGDDTNTPAADGDFSSAVNGNNGPSDAPTADGDAEGGDDDGGGERTVEEADILAQDGNTLYILNTYRGLQIVDVTDPDAPVLKGRVGLVGYPVEMYVREGRAYVVVSDYYTYWPMAEVAGKTTDAAVGGVNTFRGSVMAVIDVSDVNNPSLMGKINLEGYVSQTRAVGDVIYAVSNRYAYSSCGVTEDTEDMTTLISVDIADPENPHLVDMVSWPGSSNQIHATSHSFYVAEPIYSYNETGGEGEVPPSEGSGGGTSEGSSGENPEGGDSTSEEETATPGEGGGNGSDDAPAPPPTPDDDGGDEPSQSMYRTRLTYVDISDPQGAMAERGSIEVNGYTWDKFALNEYDDTFRIVTQKWDGVSSGTISVIDVSNPDEMSLMNETDLILDQLESVTATRFDGDRAYVVTAEQTDPLFIIDLSNPSAPRIAGHVEMPGQLTHLETNGDRLVAFGQDNSDAGTWRFAVSLFDVADMDAPVMLDREMIGEGDYSWSSATWDDKSFTLLWDEGLIAVPFTAYSYTDDDYYWTMSGGVQLLDYTPDDIKVRGIATHEGYITRVRPVFDRLLSLSDSRMLMIDATNRDKPEITADVSITRNVVDYLPTSTGGIQLIGPDWYSSSTPMGELRVVAPGHADDMATALGSIKVELQDGQLVDLPGDYVGLVRGTYDYVTYVYSSELDVYTVNNNGTPELVSTTSLPGPVYSYASAYGSYYGSSGGALVQAGNTLAYLETRWYYDNATPETDSAPGESKKPTADEWLTRLHVIDVSNPASPVLTSMEFTDSLWGLNGSGSHLFATHARYIENSEPYAARYYVDVIDVTNPSEPALLQPVNVPGTTVAIDAAGTGITTLDSQWEMSEEGYQYLTYELYTLTINRDTNKARVLGNVPLPGNIYSVMMGDGAAYALSQEYWFEMDDTAVDYCYYYGAPLNLMTINLADLSNPGVSDSQVLPIPYGYVRAVSDNHLFVDGYSGGLLVYSLADAAHPTYQDFARTSGWVLRVRTNQSTAYMPAGMYGVSLFDL